MKEVLIAGAGLGSGEISAETRRALEKCARVFIFCQPVQFEERLRGLLPRGEVLKQKKEMAWNDWERHALETIIAPARRGLSVGVLLPGHPLLYSPGDNLTRLCQSEKIAYRILPAMNFFDQALTLLEPHVRRRRDILSGAMLICRPEDILGGENPLSRHASTFLSCLFTLGLGQNLEDPRLKIFFMKLNKAYGKDGLCYFTHAGNDQGRVWQMPLKDLPKRWTEVDSMSTLFIPRHA